MIYVSVAAFCEPFLEHTLQDAVAKARWPERLVFGVIDQTLEPRRAALAALCQPAKLRYLHIHPVESRGVCWARAQAFSLYQNEDHLLQIDSHMLFEPGWDEQLLQQWQALLAQSAKPIVSTYPYGFEFEDGKPVVKINVSGKTTLVLRPHPDTDLSDTSATLRFRAEHVFTREPVRGCHVAGGFLFTAGRFVDEVPYDPHLYFHGEEQSLAVRAYTKGWDIFHPPHIPLFHLYKMPNMAHSTHHWHAEWEQQRDFKYPELTRHAKERLMDLLYERRDLGAYGLGKERSLADYARLSGIDYAKRQLVRPYQAEGYEVAALTPTLAPVAVASLSLPTPSSTTGLRIGACLPTHGRPDFVRAALLQLAAQSRVPDVVAVFQNGDAHSYEHLVRDVAWPFELQWLYTPDKVKQHEWYRQPLQRLLDAGCDVFLWTDHDDIYHSHHVATCEKELADCDFRVSKYANILYVDRTQYVLRERVRFTMHAPDGMCTSMAFNRAFAQALVQDLAQDTEHYYTNNVVAKVTMPKFKCHASDELSTTYVSHKGSHSASSWVDKMLGADGDVMSALTAVLAAPKTEKGVKEAKKRRAVAVYVDDKKYLIHQTKALWASILQTGCDHTDLVCFGPQQVLEGLPNHPRLIKQLCLPHRLAKNYGFINSIACFGGPEADLLDRYTVVLKSDVDTFLTPAWNQYWPDGFRFGIGLYVNNNETKESIRELATAFGYIYRGVHNIGSTFIGSPEDVRAVCKIATQLTEHLLEVTFAQNHGAWPGWFRGVASMYATEVAINHLFPDVGNRLDQLDQRSDSQASVNSYPHIHCWATRGDYSKHKWIDGFYKGRTEEGLDINIIADYCLAMAIRAESL